MPKCWTSRWRSRLHKCCHFQVCWSHNS